MNEPIYLKVGTCAMLDDGTVVRCVKDNYHTPSCLVCAFNESTSLSHYCGFLDCLAALRPDNEETHFEIVTE